MCQLAVKSAHEGNYEVYAEIQRLLQRADSMSHNNNNSNNNNNNKLVSASNSTDVEALVTDSVIANVNTTNTMNTNTTSATIKTDKSKIPTPVELCAAVLNTVYMGTQNSSLATQNRAFQLAQTLGAYHTNLQFDSIIQSLLNVFSAITNGKIPKYHSQGGTMVEDLALQNIQARLRMVMAYLCAALFPWVRGRKGKTFIILYIFIIMNIVTKELSIVIKDVYVTNK